MRYVIKNIGIVLCFIIILIFQNNIDAQSSQSQKLLIRDSLDFIKKEISLNTNANDYNPIPYKGGLIYISNKKTKNNPLGFNKVYWVPDSTITVSSNDSASVIAKIKFNDDYTAPTSNDNNILTRYTKKKDLNNLNSVERFFSDFNPEGSFTINDSTNDIFYTKVSSHKIKGAYRWELWHAVLKNGKLFNATRLSMKNDTANYMYPHLTNGGNTLLFSSNKVGGKGGYDIYALNKKENVWVASEDNFNDINTNSNEISPVTSKGSLSQIYFASDKIGGMGGYDIYSYTKGVNNIKNLGYPLNTINDEIAFNIRNKSFYTASKNGGSVDISSFNYNPISINIKGQVNYALDNTIVANQKLYITDVETNVITDSILTDDNARFSFLGKPNRNYLISSLNDDLITQRFEISTNSNSNKEYFKALSFNGSSPKHKTDSINKVLAKIQLQKLDSLNGYISGNKFVVYYDFDKSDLRNSELEILDSLLVLLNNNPTKYAIVGAFSDCIGSYDYNYNLSVKRANTVVSYLIQHGIAKSRIVGNGYSKQYNITPCITSNTQDKNSQLSNRRAEIVLNDNNKEDWASLEKQRGGKFYSIYNTIKLNILKSLSIIKKKAEVIKSKGIVTKDSDLITVATSAMVKKDTVISEKVPSLVIKEDAVVTKSTIPIIKKDTTVLAKQLSITKKDTTVIAKTKKDNILIATSGDSDDELSKDEIIKSLDLLAVLKREQERIVEYLTKRINKKPINVFVNSDSVTIEIYDNAIHDKDSVSIIYNNRLIVDRQELKVNQPIKFGLKVDKKQKLNELVMVAENLGSEPPNTAVMFVTEKSGRRQQIMLSTDMKHNEVVYFIKIGKE